MVWGYTVCFTCHNAYVFYGAFQVGHKVSMMVQDRFGKYNTVKILKTGTSEIEQFRF